MSLNREVFRYGSSARGCRPLLIFGKGWCRAEKQSCLESEANVDAAAAQGLPLDFLLLVCIL